MLVTREEKTTPIPTPVPASEIVANPAPINLAESNNIYKSKVEAAYQINSALSNKRYESNSCKLKIWASMGFEPTKRSAS